MERPQTPTPALVRQYIQRFDEGRDGRADKALATLFQTFPGNQQSEHVMFKVLGLNAFHNSKVIGVTAVVKHIVSLNIDEKLAQRAPELVDKIAPTPMKDGKLRRNYSFASKYCSWHVPDAYPIFDSIVERLVWEYQQIDHFAGFFWRNEMTNNYVKFRQILEALRQYYGLSEFSFKALDKYLWLYGKEYFGTLS